MSCLDWVRQTSPSTLEPLDHLRTLPFLTQCSSQKLRRLRERFAQGTQGKEKVPFATFVYSLVLHALSAQGSLGHHLRILSRVNISDSAAQQRRSHLPWEWFVALFKEVLKPRALRTAHPESFHQGMRLIAVDGSQWSLRNTQAIEAEAAPKHRNQTESLAAFFKWRTCVLLELGTHQPLAAACESGGLGRHEGELTLARRLLGDIPAKEDTLLLADRLYGCGRFVLDVQAQAGPRCQLLLRVDDQAKAKVLEVYADGSALIETRVCHPGSTRTQTTVRLREMRAQVWQQQEPGKEQAQSEAAKGPAGMHLRLWTTLLDAEAHPAKELLQLYALRWEQELFFRELKGHLDRENLLRAGTMQGAQAEFGALIVAAGFVAQQRVEAAKSVDLPPVRLSITKITHALASLLPVLSAAGDLLDAKQQRELIRRFMEQTAREAQIGERRKRSCQRGLRKPNCAWPRIQTRSNTPGTWACQPLPIAFP
jgi:hypothetical protein